MLHDWLREYAVMVLGPRWLAWLLGIATVLGGIPGIVVVAKGVGMSPLLAFLVALAVISVALNVRQAFVWRREHEKAVVADKWRERYEAEEQSRWTSGFLVTDCGGVPPSRMNRPHGVQVCVGSNLMVGLEAPIRLRFWFSKEVQENPRVWFLKDYKRHSSAEVEAAVASGHGSARVHPGGRVDVEWASGDSLVGDSRLCILAYAARPEEKLNIRDVQRRWIES